MLKQVTEILLLIIPFPLFLKHFVVHLVRVFVGVKAVIRPLAVVSLDLLHQRVLDFGVLPIALDHLLPRSQFLLPLLHIGWLLHQLVVQLPLFLLLLFLQLLELVIDCHVLLVILYPSLIFQSLLLSLHGVVPVSVFLVEGGHSNVLHLLIAHLRSEELY